MEAMRTAEALEVARDLLMEAASEHDTASPEGHRYRLALNTVEALLAQKMRVPMPPFDGPLKHLSDSRLTALCDVIIFDQATS